MSKCERTTKKASVAERAGFVVRTAKLVPETEFSPTFVQGMYDRMAVSFFKYGAVKQAYPAHADAIGSLVLRLMKYCGRARLEKAVLAAGSSGRALDGDHNLEWLMDVANFAMIETLAPSYVGAVLTGTDSSASPGRIATATGQASWKDNKSI